MIQDISEVFEKFEDEFLEFELIELPRSKRPDLHAFLLLDDLVPGCRDMVCAAEHDKFFIDVSPDDLAAVATEDQIKELVRCGIRYDSDTDSLAMFA